MPHHAWPLFDLVIKTPRLDLRPVREPDAFALIDLADQGIHDPATMPFAIPWTDEPTPDRWWNSFRWFSGAAARCAGGDLAILLGLHYQGAIIGVQDVTGERFATERSAGTGSWIGREYQGRGLGYEARVAALTLLFDGLGAQRSVTSAWWDNAASLRVTERLGYELVGEATEPRRGAPDRTLRFEMTADRWAKVRPDVAVEIDGLEPCLPLLGLTSPH